MAGWCSLHSFRSISSWLTQSWFLIGFMWSRTLIKAMCLVSLVILVGSSWGVGIPTAQALPQGDAITDGRTILRLALPISDPMIQDLEEAMRSIDRDLKYNRWSATRRDVQSFEQLLNQYQPSLVAQLREDQQAFAAAQLDEIRTKLEDLSQSLSRRSRGKSEARAAYEAIQPVLTDLETEWVNEFPFEIPAEYADYPLLLGRAKVEVETTQGSLIITLDGYNAPVTAGNFADLVQKGFYDGLGIDRVENFYVIQAGDPPGEADGYMDPNTQHMRTIPMEIRAKGEAQPYYGKTFQELGRWDAEPVLPFSAKGTIAMARYPDDPNSASSQFFLFIAEPDLTPAGLNLMDGRFAVFGYVTEGVEVVDKLSLDDQILKARVISGQEYLRNVDTQTAALESEHDA